MIALLVIAFIFGSQNNQVITLNYMIARTGLSVAAAVSLFTIIGFFLALFFQNMLVRISLSFTRAIHELFWALIFLQIFGLNTLTAILAIIIPYSAILAKVYAEILEEHDTFPQSLRGKSKISYFIFTKIPDAFPHLVSYTLYRFECALRSTAILGFVGITTLGYYLSSSFSVFYDKQNSTFTYFGYLRHFYGRYRCFSESAWFSGNRVRCSCISADEHSA